ncbi:hypothetical protein SUDANB95_00832 [Actinosynnema sp. ALI-1.44]
MIHGPLVAGMRYGPADLAPTAHATTARMPAVHGAPVHAGDLAEPGIKDMPITDVRDDEYTV